MLVIVLFLPILLRGCVLGFRPSKLSTSLLPVSPSIRFRTHVAFSKRIDGDTDGRETDNFFFKFIRKGLGLDSIASNMASLETNIASSMASLRTDMESNMSSLEKNIASNISSLRTDMSSLENKMDIKSENLHAQISSNFSSVLSNIAAIRKDSGFTTETAIKGALSSKYGLSYSESGSSDSLFTLLRFLPPKPGNAAIENFAFEQAFRLLESFTVSCFYQIIIKTSIGVFSLNTIKLIG